jgi:hypothetical protein
MDLDPMVYRAGQNRCFSGRCWEEVAQPKVHCCLCNLTRSNIGILKWVAILVDVII